MTPLHNYHERRLSEELRVARTFLQDALTALNNCESAYLAREEVNWEAVSMLAERAFDMAEASILPLNKVGVHTLRRVALD